MDWVEWHAGYDDPGSRLAHRLRIVQEQIRAGLDRLPPGPVTVVSLCAGQGRDVIEVLASRPRRADVRARLVELDPRNADAATAAARSAGLDGVEAVVGDAGLADAYAGLVPADLVVACGVFGNLTDADVLWRACQPPRLIRRRHGGLDPAPRLPRPGPGRLLVARGAGLQTVVPDPAGARLRRRRAPPDP